MASVLDVRNLGIAFRGRWVLRGWNLTLGQRERIALIGPSGCGKTSFLRALTGLVPSSEGSVLLRAPRVGYVFQEPRLIPWLDARRNLSLISDRDPSSLLARLKLSGAENLRPQAMSGGMRQRLNLARALLTEPDLLLLDEAFAALDIALKLEIFEDLNALWRSLNFASVAVTHNPRDALLIADRLLLLGGKPTRILREVLAPPSEHRSYFTPEIVESEAEILRFLAAQARLDRESGNDDFCPRRP